MMPEEPQTRQHESSRSNLHGVLARVLGSCVKLFWKQENGASLHEVILSVESKYDLPVRRYEIKNYFPS